MNSSDESFLEVLGREAFQSATRLSRFGSCFAEMLHEFIEIFTVRSFPLARHISPTADM